MNRTSPNTRIASSTSAMARSLPMNPPAAFANQPMSEDVSSHLNPAAFEKPIRQHGPAPAWDGHIPFAFWCVEQWKPRILVELGTHAGTSYFAFCQSIE